MARRAKGGGGAGGARARAQALFQRGELDGARALYEKLARQHPRDAEAHYCLGAIAGQQGRFDDAVRHLRRTVELEPRVGAGHCALGAAYKALRRFAEAEAAFRRAVQLQPAYADALLELAATLLCQGKLAEAEGWFRKVLAVAPATARAHHGLGEVHGARREVEQEIQCYRRALEIDPRLPMTHHRLGIALFTMGMFEEAVDHFREAVRLQPDLVDAYKYRGLAESKLGDREAARRAYRRALELAPDNVDVVVCEADLLEQEGDAEGAYARLAPLLEGGVKHLGVGIVLANLCRRLDRCQEAIDYLEAMLREPALPAGNREQAYFSLGKLYDGRGEYDEAFAYFEKANELRPRRFSPEEHRATFTALMELCDRPYFAAAPRSTVGSERPLFIIGMPRSGTSLVEQILASHPQVFGAGELPDIGTFVTELAQGEHGEGGYPECFRHLSVEVLDTMARRYLDHLERLAPEALRVTDKLPQNFQHLGLIALILPGARVIHCVRDARDTGLSIYFQLLFENVTFANDLRHIGLYHREYERLMAHWSRVLDLPILTVSYEELVADQEAISREIVAFAGLDWDDRCIEFHKTRRTVVTCSYDQVRRPIYASSIGRWRHYERHIGPLLEGLDNG